jgi:hypothetical protein
MTLKHCKSCRREKDVIVFTKHELVYKTCNPCRFQKGELGNIDDCKEYAILKGGECLSDIYINSRKKLKWKCSKNHIWDASYNGMKNKNNWCAKCSAIKANNRIRCNLQECKDFAINKGWECISTEYVNSKSPMSWKCENNHIWTARYSAIKDNKSNCLQCQRGSIEECK